jgi:hypothetical protein
VQAPALFGDLLRAIGDLPAERALPLPDPQFQTGAIYHIADEPFCVPARGRQQRHRVAGP